MTNLKKIWHFIWKEDSIWSWIVNIILAFILVKFIIYPGLGLVLNTSLPVVAVVSSSMEHNGKGFDQWWEDNDDFYVDREITKDMFKDFDFKNGFNTGDIIVLYGSKSLEKGDVIVYDKGKARYPIIHRIVDKDDDYITKGDNNKIPDNGQVNEEEIIGKGVFRIPYLGWVKIMFNNLIDITRK